MLTLYFKLCSFVKILTKHTLVYVGWSAVYDCGIS